MRGSVAAFVLVAASVSYAAGRASYGRLHTRTTDICGNVNAALKVHTPANALVLAGELSELKWIFSLYLTDVWLLDRRMFLHF